MKEEREGREGSRKIDKGKKVKEGRKEGRWRKTKEDEGRKEGKSPRRSG